MRYSVSLLLLALVMDAGFVTLAGGQVVIMEFMAENDSFLEDPDEAGRFEDWIELHNLGAEPVDLGGMYLTDDLADSTKWAIPDGIVMEPAASVLFWADDDEDQGIFHAGFHLDGTGEEIGLYAADGVTLIDSIAFDEQEADYSYGRLDGADVWCVMEPTPGGANGLCRSGRPTFSRAGGTFTGDLQLQLTSDVPGSEIFYTANREEPDKNRSVKVTGAITITEPTWIRARLFEPGKTPGPIASEVYLKIEDDLGDFQSNLPIVVIDTFGYNVDGEWNRNTRPYRPVMATFIDTHKVTGRAAITDPPDYAGYAGMHVRGQSTAAYPKKQYAFETWNEKSLDRKVNLLGFPIESDWILHAPYSDKTLMRNYLMYKWSNRIGRYAVRSRFVEAFVNRGDTITMDDYVGVYVFMEKIKWDEHRVNITRMIPADSEEPAITGGYLLKKDWYGGESYFTTQTYRDGLIYVDPKPELITPAQKTWIKGHFDEFERALSGNGFADPENGYAKYIAVDSFVDHHILVEMARNVDGFVLSTYVYKDRGGKINMGPIWDYNGSLGGADYFCSHETEGWHYEFDERQCGRGSERFPADNPNGYKWYARLFEDPAFSRRYRELWTELRAGPLAGDRLFADVEDAVALLTDGGAADNPVKRNFERWDILQRDIWPNFFFGGTYQDQVDWMVEWLTGRLQWMDSELVVPPELSHPGGPVSRGFELSIISSVGEIHYTLNGPDPRADDGGAAPAAVKYVGPIRIEENTRVRVRSRLSETQWSALVEAAYFTDLMPLVVTEIMYDPPRFPEDTASFSSSYEFLEFLNIGDDPLDLEGVRVLRQTNGSLRERFDFSSSSVTSLAPKEYVVIVRNLVAFRSRYGDAPRVAGEYSSTLTNAGDAVVVLGPVNEPIAQFSYDGSWYPETRGEGHSLVIRDSGAPRETWSSAGSWRPSSEIKGSPGRADGPVSGGRQIPGDYNQDSVLDVGDVVALLFRLFRGTNDVPCESEEANRLLLDATGDRLVDLSDAVHTLTYLFLGGAAHALGVDCVAVEGCPAICEAGP